MATFKVLEDYAETVNGSSAAAVLERISSEYRKGLIDQENYEELLDDLREALDQQEAESPGG